MHFMVNSRFSWFSLSCWQYRHGGTVPLLHTCCMYLHMYLLLYFVSKRMRSFPLTFGAFFLVVRCRREFRKEGSYQSWLLLCFQKCSYRIVVLGMNFLKLTHFVIFPAKKLDRGRSVNSHKICTKILSILAENSTFASLKSSLLRNFSK